MDNIVFSKECKYLSHLYNKLPKHISVLLHSLEEGLMTDVINALSFEELAFHIKEHLAERLTTNFVYEPEVHFLFDFSYKLSNIECADLRMSVTLRKHVLKYIALYTG